MSLVEIETVNGGALISFCPGRPWAEYRAFRRDFPKAKPAANWRWFVPGPTAVRRVEKWRLAREQAAAEAARRTRREAQDREWDAAAPAATGAL
ncbi:hypothetical protein [Enterovirga rhinocerotis]|uniref:Uncharacterized protein n=1 Tax=Enterovirga rhinocerotis TaxID=1339210 RepID=A0A4R7C873_9HYPH|nr:hypothetical protein [Enterovirga rhinocerotis]TDR94162.1 hypothetical protein EV668_1439 [Enterovirga rhinocerotis]